MERKFDWIQHLKVGDKVAIYGYHEDAIKPNLFRVEKVKKVTPYNIVTESWGFFDHHGQSHDDNESFICEYTPELASKIEEAVLRFCDILAGMPTHDAGLAILDSGHLATLDTGGNENANEN